MRSPSTKGGGIVSNSPCLSSLAVLLLFPVHLLVHMWIAIQIRLLCVGSRHVPAAVSAFPLITAKGNRLHQRRAALQEKLRSRTKQPDRRKSDVAIICVGLNHARQRHKR